VRPTTAVAAAVGAAVAAGGTLAWVTDRAPYPYSQRWILDLPLPLLSPARLAAVLAARPGQRVLEIGPGTGLQALHVAPLLAPGGRLDILDVQPKMLASPAAHAPAASTTSSLTTARPARYRSRTRPSTPPIS